MRQINIKNDRAAKLLDDIVKATGQGKTEAVISALGLYLKSLGASKRAEVATELARERLHPTIDPKALGRVPSKKEQEELLGM
ncbi:MAG: type II toxin-antitoxin system VapB family antitoxin [Deinococcota bacterium]|nr:type II toxin-antitoxin system VapB family antitoxin [Deinococcota bacterium]